MVNSGVVAAIHVAGVRCDPCGAVRWTVQRTAPQGSQRIPNTCIAATNAGVDHRDFKFSVLNFKKILKF